MLNRLHVFVKFAISLSIVMVLIVRLGNAEDSSVKSYQTINTTQLAISASEIFSGMQEVFGETMPDLSPVATVETFIDSTTAFVSSLLNERRVYRVAFAPTKLPLADIRPEVVDKNPLRVEVMLDSISGQVIQIDIFPAGKERYEIPYISPLTAQRQLARWGEEYLGLPESPPVKSLLETIETALANGKYFCTLHMASRVTAKYLLWRQGEGEILPVWVIDCYGGFAIGSAGCDHMRNIYNAETSEALIANNAPLPPLKSDGM